MRCWVALVSVATTTCSPSESSRVRSIIYQGLGLKDDFFLWVSVFRMVCSVISACDIEIQADQRRHMWVGVRIGMFSVISPIHKASPRIRV